MVMQLARRFGMIQNVVTGKELETKRESLGLSREELARELKVTYTTIYRWETEGRAIPPFLDLAIETIERKREKTKN